MNRRFLGLSFFLVAQVILQLKLELFKPTSLYCNVVNIILNCYISPLGLRTSMS